MLMKTICVHEGTVHPRTCQKAQKGKKMYRSTLSLTSELDWGAWSASRLGRFTPGNDLVPTCYYCLLAANHGTVCADFSLKKLGEFLSLYWRKNYHDPLRSLFVANF
jgi:hypothetical protein